MYVYNHNHKFNDFSVNDEPILKISVLYRKIGLVLSFPQKIPREEIFVIVCLKIPLALHFSGVRGLLDKTFQNPRCHLNYFG